MAIELRNIVACDGFNIVGVSESKTRRIRSFQHPDISIPFSMKEIKSSSLE